MYDRRFNVERRILWEFRDLQFSKKCAMGNSEVKIIDSVSERSSNIEITDYIILYLCARYVRFEKLLKGEHVLLRRINEERSTEVINLTLDIAGTYELFKILLEELGDDLKYNRVVEGYTINEVITPESPGGITLFGNRNKFKLNLTMDWNNFTSGFEYWKFNGEPIKKFCIERIIANRLHVIYSEDSLQYIRAFYDIFILVTNFDIDYSILKLCVNANGKLDESKLLDIDYYSKAYDKLSLDKYNELIKPAFPTVADSVRCIVNQLEQC